jgi:hypothetical protein
MKLSKIKTQANLHNILLGVTIALLIGVIIFLITDPISMINKIKNQKRIADSATIHNALSTYENIRLRRGFGGLVRPSELKYMIGNCNSEAAKTCTATTVEDKCMPFDFLVKEKYLINLPYDPASKNEMTGYYYQYDTKGKFTIGACHPDTEMVRIWKKTISLYKRLATFYSPGSTKIVAADEPLPSSKES